MIQIRASFALLSSLNQIRKSSSGGIPTCDADTKYTWEREQQFKTTETITKKESTTWQWPASSESNGTKNAFSQQLQNLGSWISKKIPTIDNQGPTEFQRGRVVGYEEGFRDGAWKGMSMTALYGTALVGISTIFGRLYGSRT
jgi:hypothetical protein